MLALKEHAKGVPYRGSVEPSVTPDVQVGVTTGENREILPFKKRTKRGPLRWAYLIIFYSR